LVILTQTTHFVNKFSTNGQKSAQAVTKLMNKA